MYQWLPSMSMGPQVIDPAFSRHLDLSFTVNTEKYEKHRALHLLNVSRQLSGSYMCKVSSFLDEDFNQRNVMIYGELQVLLTKKNNYCKNRPGILKFLQVMLCGCCLVLIYNSMYAVPLKC